MNLDFFVVMSNLVSLFVLIAAGYAASRSGLVKHEAMTHFSALLMKITLPCTIFISLVQKEYDPAFINDNGAALFTSASSFGGFTELFRSTRKDIFPRLVPR